MLSIFLFFNNLLICFSIENVFEINPSNDGKMSTLKNFYFSSQLTLIAFSVKVPFPASIIIDFFNELTIFSSITDFPSVEPIKTSDFLPQTFYLLFVLFL